MRKSILFLFGLLLSTLVLAQTPYGIRIQQWDGAGTLYGKDMGVPPASATGHGFFFYNGTTIEPMMAGLGSGLVYVSGFVTHDGSAVWGSVSGKPAYLATFNGSYASLTGTPSLAVVATSGSYADLSNKPSIPAAQVQTDWNASSGLGALLNKPSLATVATTGSYNDLSNKPTIPTVVPFNFSQPTTRTLAVSTSYQATDPTKAAIVYPSFSCQNATTVLAASGCTVQVRVGTGTLTCSTGTVYYTQSLTVALGVLITQNSINPVPIFLPSSGSFIICPTTGTFTTTVVEQSVG